MISSWVQLVTKSQSRKQVAEEMRGKKGLTGAKMVEKELEKTDIDI